MLISNSYYSFIREMQSYSRLNQERSRLVAQWGQLLETSGWLRVVFSKEEVSPAKFFLLHTLQSF